jgi:hypothetical protein
MLRIGDTDGVVNIVGTSSLGFNKYWGSLLDAHIYIPLDRPFLSKHIASSIPEYIAGGILSAGCLDCVRPGVQSPCCRTREECLPFKNSRSFCLT